MFTRKFLNKFAKYLLTAIVIGAVVAGIATGVGAALGAAGALGAGGAAGGISAIWAPVASGMATIGNALGLTSIFGGLTSLLGLPATAAAAVAGTSVVVGGAYAVTGAAAAVSASREVAHERRYIEASKARAAARAGIRQEPRIAQPQMQPVRHMETQPQMYAQNEMQTGQPSYMRQGSWAQHVEQGRSNQRRSPQVAPTSSVSGNNDFQSRLETSRMQAMTAQPSRS